MTNFILGLIYIHKYTLLFFAILATGDAALIPAVYGSWFGSLNIWKVFFISVGTVLLSDSIWYFVGGYVPTERLLKRKFLKKHRKNIEEYGEIFKMNAFKIVFFSKFLMGLRIPFQILAGVNRIGYPKYILTSLSGSAVWTILIIGIIGLTNASVGEVESLTGHIQLVITILIALYILAYFLNKNLKKKLFS